MKLGDFFQNAPYARPVNPKPVTFTGMVKGTVLPGGAANPHGRPIAATLKAAFVFLSGEDTIAARIAARNALREKTEGGPVDERDFELELVYQVLWRAMFEWEDAERTAGGRLFETADLLKSIVVPREANRLYGLYGEYVASEHPEGVDDATFRGAEGGGKGAPPRAPG